MTTHRYRESAIRLAMILTGLTWEPAPSFAATPPDRPPTDKASSAAEEEIPTETEGAQLLLRSFPEFSQVKLRTRDTILILEGAVPSDSAKEALIPLVRTTGDFSYIWDKTSVLVAKSTAATPDDSLIQAQLESVFSNVEGLRDVQVEVKSQVVTLRGESSSEKVIERAEQLARDSKGVVFVENRIRKPTQVDERVKPALDRMKERFLDWLVQAPLLLIALLIVAGFVFASRFIQRVQRPFQWIESQLVRDIVQRIIGTMVIAVGVLIALELLDLTALVGAVFGAAGAAGIILGFAFRDIIENYLASIILSVRRPFSKNDHVLIDSHEGKVLRLTSRDTILMTLEGNHLRLPNAVVFKAKILNYTRNPLRRFDFSVGLGVDEDISGAIRLGQSTLDSTPGVCDVPPPFARVEELGDSNVALRYFCWVDQREADWFKVRSEAIRRTKVALDAAGVDMPVPTYQVNLNQNASNETKLKASGSLDEAAHEVSVDAYIEDQIASDQSLSNDKNLL